MFTGIVEETGTLKNIISGGHAGEISIKASKVLEGTKVGDSIAVNGVCLTVTKLLTDGFTADVMPQTIRNSSLGQISYGGVVNLERAMAADGRFGGHIVSGHIDGVGTVAEIKKEENAVWFKIKPSKEILAGIVEKGSITIDGISLTVAELGTDYFKVSVIPHTAEVTNLMTKNLGDKVNLENDIVGKYVKRFLLAGNLDGVEDKRDSKNRPYLSLEYLQNNGF